MTQPDTPQDIPTVAFYGESGDWSTAALLHSETLIERSSVHAWKIRPHRHNNLVQLFWLSRGHGVARLDTQRTELTAPCVAVIPERCVHEFQWSRSCGGFAVSLASALVHDLRRDLKLGDDAFRQAAALPAGDDLTFLETLFERIQNEYLSETIFKQAALDSLVRALAVWVARHAPTTPGRTVPASRGAVHFSRFTQLLDQLFKAQWSVAEFAHVIGVSASHLNTICHVHGGGSAKQLIQARVLLAARRELAYTDKSIADIALGLGFSDASYFTRFFKRNMQMTPRQYRRSTGTQAGHD